MIIMSKAVITLEPLGCPSCMQKIEGAVKQVKGVDKDSVKVLFNSSKVKVNFDDAQVQVEAMVKAIEDLGYPVIKAKVSAA